MRVATLDLTPELFVEFAKACKNGPPRRFIVKDNPLPEDAKIIRVRLSLLHYPETLQLLIESESFEDVAKGTRPPELPQVVFSTQYDECTTMVA